MLQWRAIWALVRKDILIWSRQPTSIAATLLPTLGFVVIILIEARAVGRNPVALVVQDGGPHARELARIITESDAFVAYPMNAAQADAALRTVQIAAAITIPANFDAAVNARQPAPVSITMNNLNLDFTNDLRRSLPAAITRYYAAQSEDPIKIRVAETDLRAADINLAQFELLPGLVLLITIAGIVNSGLALAREFEEETFKELLLAPVTRTTLIVGKFLAGWLTTLGVAAVVLILGALLGLLRPQGFSWVITLAMVALLALASAGMGVTLGALFRGVQRTTGISIPFAFYLFFLSGGISVPAFLPDWVQAIAQFIPTTYAVHALEMAVFYNSTDQVARDFAVVGMTTALTLILGVWAIRRRALA